MDKDKLLAALNALQDGADAGAYNDELETLITLVVNGKDEDIRLAWEDLRLDDEDVAVQNDPE